MPLTKRFAIGGWLRGRADDVAVALIGTMFVCFILQIGFRYLLNRPLGWTEEVTILCWVWVVLWGAAFILADHEEIRFDIIYGVAPEPARRAFTVITSIALILLLAISLPATWNYVLFMKREHSAFLHIRFDVLYSIYVIFSVACIVKHIQIVWMAIRGAKLPESDPAEQGDRP